MSTLATLPRGDQRTIAITCSESLDTATSVIFTAKKSKGLADTAATFQHALGAGVTVSGTIASVAVVHNDTASLTCATTLFCDVQASFSGRSHVTVWEGTLPVTLDVTVESDTSVPIYTTSPSATTSAIAAAAAALASAGDAADDAEQTALDRIATGEDRTQTGLDRVATGEDRTQTGLDRTQTGLDVVATGEDVVATGEDRTATGEDRTQTGLDRVQTGLDRVATGQDKTATAADRVQTGLDRTAAAGSAADALTSKNAAAASATLAQNAVAQTFRGGVAGASVPATSTAAGDWYVITSAGTSQSQTWAINDHAIYNGTSGNWTQVSGNLVSQLDLAGKQTRGGIVSAGTSPVGTTQDNTGLAFGTSDLTIGMWVRLPDWTPSSTRALWRKATGGVGPIFELVADGKLQLTLDATQYKSSVATGSTDEAWLFIVATIDRDGNFTPYTNGAALGAAVSIAAQSATSMTVATPMLWFSSGGTQTAGTLGESWIINGLLSASRIADIHRAGSIAPFCTYTANATTGRDIATIDGLSFFTWPDFERADPINWPIAMDKSGNGQHAILGTSGLKALNPPTYVNQAPDFTLVNDGSAGARVHSTLNAQNPVTGELVVRVKLLYPQDAAAGSKRLWSLCSSLTNTITGLSLHCHYDTSLGLVFRICGANPVNSRYLASLALHNHLAAMSARGIQAVLDFRRSATGPRVFLGVGDDARRYEDVTYQFAESTAGDPVPAWTDEIDGDYLVSGYVTSTVSSAHTLAGRVPLLTANVAMTEAQLRTEYQRGEPGPEWVGASNNLGIINYSFESDTSSPPYSWLQAGNHTITAVADVTAPAGANVAEIVASGTGSWTGNEIHNASGPARSPGRSYVVKFWAKSISGSTALSLNGNFSGSLTLTGSWAEYTSAVYTAPSAGALTCAFLLGGAGTARIDNVRFIALGWTTRLRTDQGGGYQARNDARSATNDSTNFDLSTTGITWSPEAPVGTRVSITGTKLHSEISATGGTTVFGVRPAGWRVIEYQQNQDVAFDTGLTLDLGTVGTPNLFVSALALDATGFKQADSLSKVPSSLTASQTIYGKKSGGTTAGNILRYTIILERTY